MKRSLLVVVAVLLLPLRFAAAHCEVPCGIYADQRRFEQMLEDQTTIAKAVASITQLTEEFSDGPNVLGIKESHATNTQHIIAQYFMTQRIKPGSEGYGKKLMAAHAVMVAAMKCKQTADPATAEALREAILDFYRAYEGKEPQFED
jgi:nickel superoxide dismutase